MSNPPAATFRRGSSIDIPGNRNVVKAVVQDTELVTAINANQNKQGHKYDIARLVRHSTDSNQVYSGLSSYEDELRSRLSKAVFVGHINTDLDSVAGAIAGAELFGGTAALAEPLPHVNGEIIYALKNCGLEPPLYFDDITGSDKCDICLVDHTEEKQMVPSLRTTIIDRVVGVIDHHALAKNFGTKRPIYMDLRPWGSMCTILGYLFVSQRRALRKNVATLMLQAILSDTLNLRSVTTTEADRSMVALLHSYAGIGNATKLLQDETALVTGGIYQDNPIDVLAKKQFQAKTSWIVGLGPYEMVRGDQKDFVCGPWKFGISVLEVTDTTQVMNCAGNILLELRLLKKEKALSSDGQTMDRTLELDFAFLFVVNVVEQTLVLLIAGGRELALAKAAFMHDNDSDDVTLFAATPDIEAPGSTIHPDETAMFLPKGYVSRKAQFVPAFFKAIEEFEYENDAPRSESKQYDHACDIASDINNRVHISKTSATSGPPGSQSQVRRDCSFRQSFHANAMETTIFRENECDEAILKVKAQKAKENHGNLYNSIGRVIRPSIMDFKNTITNNVLSLEEVKEEEE